MDLTITNTKEVVGKGNYEMGQKDLAKRALFAENVT